MQTKGIGIVASACAVLMIACGGLTTGGANTPTPTTVLGSNNPPSTLAPIDTPAETATATVTTALDPCVLVPKEEASALTGVSFDDGTEETTSGGGKRCIYGSNTLNVFTVIVVQGKDQATVEAAKADFQADLEANMQQLASQGIEVTELPDYADGAFVGQGSADFSGQTINGSAIGVLKGLVFFGISDIALNGPAPSTDALKAEADTVLGRIP